MVEFEGDQMKETKLVPDLSSQKSQIQEKLHIPMVVGQSWYIIDARWFKTFKYFVGLADSQNYCNEANNPGPIDNSLLLDENSSNLKKDLVVNLDYVEIPSSAWDLLFEWYGIKDSQEPIVRMVVNLASPPKIEPRLEVYPVELKLYNSSEFLNPVMYSFSGADSISKIEDVCRTLFKIPDEQQFSLRCFYGPQSHPLNRECTIHQESLDSNLRIVVELGERKKRLMKTTSSWTRRVVPTTRSHSNLMSRYSTSGNISSLGTAEGCGPPCTPGLSGLMNLGNTCFLNSIIQCLSNCKPITKYFLDKNHESEINATNPLGKAGLIATSFADLINLMWSGLHTTIVPHCFKAQLTKFAPQFAGCQQHDAQELLTFLLDGLHEDLNRIKEKPYCQTDDNDQEEDALAQASWENFLRRNDSIIIDHFHGMLKSRVVCPDCETVSMKFDTFSTLSVPLPLRYERAIMVRFVPYDQSTKVVDILVDVPKRGIIQDLIMELSRVTSINPNLIIVAQVYKNHFHKFFSHNDPIQGIDDRDKIYMYDIPASLVEDTTVKYTVLPVVLWEVGDTPHSTHFPGNLFGTPFLLMLPRGPMYFKKLYDTVCDQMIRTCEEFARANTDFGCFSVQYDSAEGGELSMADSTNAYLFNPVFVNTFCYENVQKLDTLENEIFIVPDSFGRDLLALQIERKVHKEHYKEETPLVLDHSESLKPPSKCTLDDCITLFTNTEKLAENNAWHCPRCNEKKRATKKLDLWKLPNILIVHLKRFAFNEVKKEKLDTKIEFPLTELNIDRYVATMLKEKPVYDLIGVCNHYGVLMGGHYTATCKNFKDGNWYCFDDNSVTPISPESVQTENAYVLFYWRRPVTKADPNEEKVDL